MPILLRTSNIGGTGDEFCYPERPSGLRIRHDRHAGAEQSHADGVRREFRVPTDPAAYHGGVGGMSVMALLVGTGLMALFDAVPALNLVLKVISVGYLLWLAFKIATAAPLEERDADSRPMTFLWAATFQGVNPKAWAMCLSAITLYAPDRSLLSVAIVAPAFTLVCFPAIAVWAWLGTVVCQWLSNATRLRAFNITMAALLVASLYSVLGLGT
ncbi:LysE family translocator [Rhodovulum sulfidophilum]|nr:LysE family translocator [Rhodovulum sulfidophilum]